LAGFDVNNELGKIGAGRGPLKGKIWPVGLMDLKQSERETFLSALGQILNDSRRKTDFEAALAASA